MKVNVELLRKQIEWAEANPKEWNQTYWGMKASCGTAFCIAGHTVVDAGHEVRWEEVHAVLPLALATTTTAGLDIENLAASILGIGMDDAFDLFESNNTLADLWRIASEVTDGEIEIPIQHQEAA